MLNVAAIGLSWKLQNAMRIYNRMKFNMSQIVSWRCCKKEEKPEDIVKMPESMQELETGRVSNQT